MEIAIIALFIIIAAIISWFGIKTYEPIFLMFAGILLMALALEVFTGGYQIRSDITVITSANYTYFADSGSRELSNMTIVRTPTYSSRQDNFTFIFAGALIIAGMGLFLKAIDFIRAGRPVKQIGEGG